MQHETEFKALLAMAGVFAVCGLLVATGFAQIGGMPADASISMLPTERATLAKLNMTSFYIGPVKCTPEICTVKIFKEKAIDSTLTICNKCMGLKAEDIEAKRNSVIKAKLAMIANATDARLGRAQEIDKLPAGTGTVAAA